MSAKDSTFRLSKPVRKSLLAAHVITSVGWLGITLADLVLAITVNTTSQPATQHSIYWVLRIIGNVVLLPISLSALVTGVLVSLGTPWGLLRYRWVLVKFGLTVVTVLLTWFSLTPGLRESAAIVAHTPFDQMARVDGSDLMYAACVSTTVYTGNVLLSIFKPWGRTGWGRRVLAQR
ncbi:MAG TPA: hypothetical protein VE172_12085 [Stackebrandtia sp.]|jgi:hypothetical protein|uniref:hypothetical protein n=1 Tax=Stackebrandtia sp. TaxID=2023065 RepID=UPI002D333D72|nr:hypothetical protein [Stackebrandtia sp.]HZE39539.1 hypothetical protein [Stackebrandtia sp.]